MNDQIATRRSALAPFRISSYRYLWFSDALTLWGFEMETLILGWFVLVETNSAIMVGVVGALRFIGTLISPVLGVYVDRLSKCSVLVAMRIVFALVAMTMFLAAWSGTLQVWHALLAAAVAGALRPPEMVVRQSLIADAVPQAMLMNAMGFARVTMDTSKIVGALAGAGAMAAFGIANAYLIIGCMYVGSLVLSTLIVSAPPAVGESTTSALSELKAGIAHIRASTTLTGVMWLAFLANLVAFPLSQGLLPVVARDALGQDAIGLAQLVASTSAGALVGSLLLGVMPTLRPERLMIIGLLIWQSMICAFAFALTLNLVWAHLLLFASGLASSMGMISMSVVVMSHAHADFRGRVMGIRMLAVYGLPMGLLLGGVLFETVGIANTLLLMGVSGFALFVVTALVGRRYLFATPARTTV